MSNSIKRSASTSFDEPISKVNKTSELEPIPEVSTEDKATSQTQESIIFLGEFTKNDSSKEVIDLTSQKPIDRFIDRSTSAHVGLSSMTDWQATALKKYVMNQPDDDDDIPTQHELSRPFDYDVTEFRSQPPFIDKNDSDNIRIAYTLEHIFKMFIEKKD